MNLLKQIYQSRVVKYIASPRLSLRERKARRTLEDKLMTAGTESNFSILDTLLAEDVLGTSEVLDRLERHEFYGKAADLGYGHIQPLDDSLRAELAELAAKSGYSPRFEPRDSNERGKLAWRTIINYLKSAQSKHNPFPEAAIAANIAVSFFGIRKTVEDLERQRYHWEAACLCEGYIAPVTARDREEYYNPLNINKAADFPERKQFAQRAIDNYLRSTPKDVNGAVRIAFDVFGEPKALEICRQYGVDIHSTMDDKERKMREYHKELGALTSQPFNPEALRQIIITYKDILQPEIVRMILSKEGSSPTLNSYNLIMRRHRVISG